jgi:hypothetical protein
MQEIIAATIGKQTNQLSERPHATDYLGSGISHYPLEAGRPFVAVRLKT